MTARLIEYLIRVTYSRRQICI